MVSRSERAMNYVILVLFAIFALAPILSIFGAALLPQSGQSGAGILGLNFSNFGQAWREGNFAAYMRTSLIVSVSVVLLSTVLSTLSGYAFGTMRFRGSTALFYTFLVGIMIPAEAVVVPLFFDLRTLGLTDTIWALIFPQVAQSVAFGTFWMRANFRSMPRSIIEAAVLDGAGSFRVLRSVLVPVAKPGLMTLVVLVFMWTWNEFLIPLVMAPSGELRTAPLALAIFKGQHVESTSLLAAGSVIVALPVVVLYLILQRHFIRGMLEGAAHD